MRLARKISLSLEVGILVLVLVYAYFQIGDDTRAIRAGVRSELSWIAKETSLLIAKQDPATARDTLRQLADQRSTVEIRWVYFDVPPGSIDAPRTSSGIVRPVIRDGEREVDDGEQISLYRGFVDPDGRMAAIEVSRPTDDIDHMVRDARARTVGLVALIVLLGTIYSVSIGSRLIAHPMQRLTAQFRRVGAGDLSPIEVPPRRDEIGELTRELDTMIGRLSESRTQVAMEHAARLATAEQLQHAERLTTVGRLASGLAHELGTPLNVISGHAKLIVTGQEAGAGAVDSARTIAEQSERITNIVRQLLDFARRGAPKLVTSDVRPSIARAVNMSTVVAHKEHVQLSYTEPSDPLVAEIDDGRIQQVVVNLLNNAIYASPEGAEVALEIAHACVARPGDAQTSAHVRLDVVDHGRGISPDDLRRVFEPFFTTKPVGEGTGLGLSVSHGIVDEHHGWIEVSSELGHGSRFSVYLPEIRSSPE